LHLFVIQGWKQIPLLVCVEKVGMQGIVENIFHLMFIAMVTFRGLSVKQLGAKFISMGCNGSSVFQGAKASITTQMKENLVPFLMGVHYFAH
jgi:hypothetical protein